MALFLLLVTPFVGVAPPFQKGAELPAHVSDSSFGIACGHHGAPSFSSLSLSSEGSFDGGFPSFFLRHALPTR